MINDGIVEHRRFCGAAELLGQTQRAKQSRCAVIIPRVLGRGECLSLRTNPALGLRDLQPCEFVDLAVSLELRPGNTYGPRSERAFARSRILMHRGERGARCSVPAFIRLAGIVHVFLSRSISAQVAFSVSDVRDAHKMVNSKASLTSSPASASRRLCRNAGTC